MTCEWKCCPDASAVETCMCLHNAVSLNSTHAKNSKYLQQINKIISNIVLIYLLIWLVNYPIHFHKSFLFLYIEIYLKYISTRINRVFGTFNHTHYIQYLNLNSIYLYIYFPKLHFDMTIIIVKVCIKFS